MELRVRSLLCTLVVGCILFAASPAFPHPPWDPFDDTRFAPITKFAPKLGIEVVTRGINDPVTGAPVGPLLVSPLKTVTAVGLPNHIFVVDQPGVIWVVNLTTGVRTQFLDAQSIIITLGVCGPNTFDERGLLGLAFHPDYQSNGKFYTYTSELATSGVPTIPQAVAFDPDHHNVVSEWVNANPGNPVAPNIGARRELLRVAWPQFNHDGGDLAFGPDGKLYISMGDGGGADDADGQDFILARPKHLNPPDCSLSAPITGHQGNGNAQKLNTALGKILRIDVNPPFSAGKQYKVPENNPFVHKSGAVPEIWAYGFRNPYRIGFDKKKGDLWLGDVGQNDLEEVDIVRKGGNFGWNCKEGTLFFHINGNAEGFASKERDPSRTDCRNDSIDPVAQYDTHHEGHSAIGGYVYHGKAVPSLRGKYVFADFSLLFKFPSGPHDYGRVFTIDAGDHPEGHGRKGHHGQGHGLRKISEAPILPGGSISLGILGIGQDAHGEIYVMGNVNGIPFSNNGVIMRLTLPPEVDKHGHEDDDDDKHRHGHDD